MEMNEYKVEATTIGGASLDSLGQRLDMHNQNNDEISFSLKRSEDGVGFGLQEVFEIAIWIKQNPIAASVAGAMIYDLLKGSVGYLIFKKKEFPVTPEGMNSFAENLSNKAGASSENP